jgi:amino acid permease
MALQINRESIDEPLAEPEQFTLITGYIFAINSVIGAGFLSIPWAYENSGWLFSLIFQLCVAIHSLYLLLQLLEMMSRAEVLLRMTESSKDIHSISLKQLFKSTKTEDLMLPPHLIPTITTRVINISDIVKIVFGEKLGFFYVIITGLFGLGALVAYSAIFASSFVSNVPLGPLETCDIYESSEFFSSCRVKYWVFLTIFFVFTLYMTMNGIQEQKTVQYLMSVLRFVVIFLIIVTCIYSMSNSSSLEDDSSNRPRFPSAVKNKNIGHAIPIILFATCYHTQVPSISHLVKDKKKNLKKIHLASIFTCCFFYVLLGIITSTVIENVPSMVSMSYRNYSAGHSSAERPAWTYIIEYIILISPALDVMTTFPVFALAISSSLVSWKYEGNIDLVEKKVLLSFRFFVVFIPIFISFFVFDLGQILDWAGLLAFIVIHIPIPLLHTGIRHLVQGRSDFDVWGAYWVNLILSFVAFALLMVVVVMNLLD